MLPELEHSLSNVNSVGILAVSAARFSKADYHSRSFYFRFGKRAAAVRPSAGGVKKCVDSRLFGAYKGKRS